MTNDVDVYAHFWWDKSYKDQVIRFEFDDRYEEDEGQAFINLYKPKAYKFEKQEQFDLSGFNFENPGVCTNSLEAKMMAFNCTSMWHSVNRAFDLAKLQGIEYDLYVRCRTDLIFTEKVEWSTLDLDVLYTGDGRIAGEDRIFGDWFSAGNLENMRKYCLLREFFPVYNSNMVIHMHDFLMTALLQLDLTLDYKKIRAQLSMMIPDLESCLDKNKHIDPQVFCRKWSAKELNGSVRSIQANEYKDMNKEDLPHYVKDWKELK